MILFLLFTISAALIFILLETDALAEYATKLRIPLPYLKEFMEYRKTASGVIHYIDFLGLKKDTFFVRLIGCAVCLSFVFNFFIHIIAYFAYGWVAVFYIFPNFIMSCITYFLLKILSRLADEQPN